MVLCTYSKVGFVYIISAETAPYNPDIIDLLGLPDGVLVDYCQSTDNSENPKVLKRVWGWCIDEYFKFYCQY